jgi:putative addiction module component (TIGR02574 family)
MITVESIIEEALKKPENERARIAEILISSLHGTEAPDIEEAWQKEIAFRLKQIDSCEVECINWEEIRSRIYKNANIQS